MDMQVGTEIPFILMQTDENWWTGGVKMCWYDTADDTYTVGTTIITNPQSLNCYNETGLIELDNGDYVAFVRVDAYTGSPVLKQVAFKSTDQGETWDGGTDLESAWGLIGGTVSFAKFYGRYFASGYERSATVLHRHLIFEFDPDTYAKIGSNYYPLDANGDGNIKLQDAGNGTMLRVPGTNTVTLSVDVGSAAMYLLDVGGLVPQLDQPVLTPDVEQVTVEFTASVYSDSTNLYWSTTDPVTTADNKVEAVTSPYVITGLSGGVPIYVAVAGMFSGDEGSLSTQASATPLSPTPPTPSGEPLPPPQRDRYNPNSLELRVLRTIGENL
jgi:hypothetical protein